MAYDNFVWQMKQIKNLKLLESHFDKEQREKEQLEELHEQWREMQYGRDYSDDEKTEYSYSAKHFDAYNGYDSCNGDDS